MNVLENFKNLFIDVWQDGVSGINISEIIIALVIFTFFLFLRGVFSKFVVKKLESYVSKSTNSFDNSLVYSMEGPAKFFPIVLGFFISTSYLTVDSGMVDTINRSLITILIFWTFHQVVGPFSSVIKSAGGLI
jgi:MscS family membrane protein